MIQWRSLPAPHTFPSDFIYSISAGHRRCTRAVSQKLGSQLYCSTFFPDNLVLNIRRVRNGMYPLREQIAVVIPLFLSNGRWWLWMEQLQPYVGILPMNWHPGTSGYQFTWRAPVDNISPLTTFYIFCSDSLLFTNRKRAGMTMDTSWAWMANTSTL